MIREYNIYDNNGTLQSSHLSKVKRIRGNFIIIFSMQLREFIKKNPTPAVMKIFLWICSKQTFSPVLAVSQSAICKGLKMTQATVSKAMKWLYENDYVKYIIVDGVKSIIINPNFTTRGFKLLKERNEWWLSAKVGEFYGEDSDVCLNVTLLPQQSVESEETNQDWVQLYDSSVEDPD